MKRNNLIENIVNRKDRLLSTHAMSEMIGRLTDLEHAFQNHNASNNELLRYYPVAIVAIIEGYSRLAIAEIINKGEPYLSRSEVLVRTDKFDFEILKGINGENVTVGDIVSHIISISKFEHISNAFSKILDKKIIDDLPLLDSRWQSEIHGDTSKIIKDGDHFIMHVNKMFEIRHVICHEIASNFKIELSEIQAYFQSCVSFLKALEELVTRELYPNAPLTQSSMNEKANKDLMETEKELNAMIFEIQTILDPHESTDFDEICVAQEKTIETWARFQAKQFEYGSIYPVIYCGERNAQLQRWIDELRTFMKNKSER